MSEDSSLDNLISNAHRLPIFPLKGVVLLPYTVFPLHVFESRYVQMLEDVLDTHKLICMTNWREPDAGPISDIHSIAGVGQVVQHMQLPDNRHFIVLKGIASVHIEAELTNARLYREVKSSVLPPLDEALSSTAQTEIRLLLKSIILHAPEQSSSIQELISLPELRVTQLNALASICVQPSELRQHYLEERSIDIRVDMVTMALAQALAHMNRDND